MFRCGVRVGVADVVFGEEGDATLLGVTTLGVCPRKARLREATGVPKNRASDFGGGLEALGLAFEPLGRELKELPLLRAVKAFRPG